MATAAAEDRAQAPVMRDRDGAVGIGPQYGGALGAQGGDGAGRWVAIRVVGAAGDQGQAGAEVSEQLWILVGRAMVGDLEDVDLGEGRVCRQQGLLGGGFEVAQEEQGQARRADEEGDACVVRALGRGRGG
ncbi:hypothetical protein GCM10009574_022620 [Streptomyces asiaticus]|uniref:Uncharacterized protein n=2 Tax=Streptomyces rhizosphaericus TaxID=114699 RepID=A0ABN1S3V1_9ACTN